MGRFWGRGRFSERSASPPDPLSRRAAGVWRGTLLLAWFRLSVGVVPCKLVESTAADRAAADVRGEGYPQSDLRLTAPSAEGAFGFVHR